MLIQFGLKQQESSHAHNSLSLSLFSLISQMKTAFGFSFFLFLAATAVVSASIYSVQVESIESIPVLSYVQRTSAYQQIFNPSYIIASSATGGMEGIVARTQNCSASVGGGCVSCGGPDEKAR